MGKYTGFDDEWILANRKKYTRWSEMYADYQKEHPESSYPVHSFRTHCNQDLRLTFRYTPEQDVWICDYYPEHGAKATLDAYTTKFGISRGIQGFKTHIKDLGLRVSEERLNEANKDNGHHEGMPEGTRTVRGRGQAWIKTKDGWKEEHKHLIGEIPKDCQIVHLDGNKANNSLDNLRVISKKTGARMTVNKFWSEEKEVTKAGILCGELEGILNEVDCIK